MERFPVHDLGSPNGDVALQRAPVELIVMLAVEFLSPLSMVHKVSIESSQVALESGLGVVLGILTDTDPSEA